MLRLQPLEQTKIARFRVITALEDPGSPTSAIFISKAERDEKLADGSIIAVAPKTFRIVRTAHFPVRGFSARYGETLAAMKKTDIGRLLVAEITKRPMEATA